MNEGDPGPFAPNPYVDYSRFPTMEGGIAIIYKDIDVRLRHELRRLALWSAASGCAVWYLLEHSPIRNLWINLVCLLIVATINRLIVARPIEVYRRIEIRPDCLIIEDRDVFWLRYMEGGWPVFTSDADGNLVLGGTYGTRYVEYLTVHRVNKKDEQDRTAQILTAHLKEAMQQLWSWPY